MVSVAVLASGLHWAAFNENTTWSAKRRRATYVLASIAHIHTVKRAIIRWRSIFVTVGVSVGVTVGVTVGVRCRRRTRACALFDILSGAFIDSTVGLGHDGETIFRNGGVVTVASKVKLDLELSVGIGLIEQEIDSEDLLKSGLFIWSTAITEILLLSHDDIVSEEPDGSDSSIWSNKSCLIDDDVDLLSHTFGDTPLKDVNVVVTCVHYGKVVLEKLDAVQGLLGKLALEVTPIDIDSGQNRRRGVISTFLDCAVGDCSASIGACSGDVGCDLVESSFVGGVDLDLSLDVRSLIRDRVSRRFDADCGFKRADAGRQTSISYSQPLLEDS